MGGYQACYDAQIHKAIETVVDHRVDQLPAAAPRGDQIVVDTIEKKSAGIKDDEPQANPRHRMRVDGDVVNRLQREQGIQAYRYQQKSEQVERQSRKVRQFIKEKRHRQTNQYIHAGHHHDRAPGRNAGKNVVKKVGQKE